jgi:hypothetical protein
MPATPANSRLDPVSSQGPLPLSAPELAAQLTRIEERLARLEQRLELGAVPEPNTAEPEPTEADEAPATVTPADDFELVVGQAWFTRLGIMALAVGAAFALSLPYSSAPAALPGVVGYGVAGSLFLLAWLCKGSLELLSQQVFGAAMGLLYFATLRLFFFGSVAALAVDSMAGRALLALAVGINLAIAWKRASLPLTLMALAAGYLSALLGGAGWFASSAIVLLSAYAVLARLQRNWPSVVLFAIVAGYATHLAWFLGLQNPQQPGSLSDGALLSVLAALAYMAVLAGGALLRPNSQEEDPPTILASMMNAGLGYGAFLLHAIMAAPASLILTQLSAAAVLMGLAIAFWVTERSRYSTFFYAMTAYLALSAALLKAFDMPLVFVWLSLQSVIVVTTALWFRSPPIIVANFFIYVGIAAGYLFAVKEETGISVWFGVVALVSARILNWQQRRLQLKTDLMRNAYLVSAFAVFPYALYHLAPGAYVAVSWVGVALMYYLLSFVVQNEKYRWLGHGTLLLTAIYVLAIGLVQMTPSQRILTCVVLGAALLIVSLLFTRAQAKRAAQQPEGQAEPSAAGPD